EITRGGEEGGIRPEIRRGLQAMFVSRLHDVIGDGVGNEGFELAPRQTPSAGIGSARDQPVRDIVGMALAGLEAVGRGQPVAGLVAELAGKRRGLGIGPAAAPAPRRGLQLLLYVVPERLINVGRVTPRPDKGPVADLAAI